MIDLLLVILYYFSLFMMSAGIWMIISTIISKDKSMGMGAVIGVVSIFIGLLFYAVSYTSDSDSKTPSHSENPHPVPTIIPSSIP